MAEVGEVRIDVEGEAVHRPAPGDTHADGADFLCTCSFTDPDPDRGFITMRFDAELIDRVHHDFLKHPHISANGQAMVVQSNDWIHDQLARPVKGDVATAIGLGDFNTEVLELPFGCDEVFLKTRPPPKCDHRRMLDEEQLLLAACENVGVWPVLGSLYRRCHSVVCAAKSRARSAGVGHPTWNRRVFTSVTGVVASVGRTGLLATGS